jgi:hypothetical protein
MLDGTLDRVGSCLPDFDFDCAIVDCDPGCA